LRKFVILSRAKDLNMRRLRSFAALRMTTPKALLGSAFFTNKNAPTRGALSITAGG
jgi:hypothetical protein